MSWRREERSRWEDRGDRDRDRELRDRDRERDRDRDRWRRSPSPASPRRDRRRRRRDSRDGSVPPPPSPPKISQRSRSRTPPRPSRSPRDRSRSRSPRDARERDARRDDYDDDDQSALGFRDWLCKCGLYNFKRRQQCYRRNCDGKRSDGIVLGGDNERNMSESSGITKCLRFRRLDALTTEEKILEAIKDRCSKSVLDSIAGITIGREALTGASKCLAYINFNSIADSTAAHSELLNLHPPLEIDGRNVLISFNNGPKKPPKPSDYSPYYSQMSNYSNTSQTGSSLSEADRVNAAAAVAQLAIASAQARNSWTPVTTPTFTTNVTPPKKLPSGDGKTVYTAPDVTTFMYDEHSGYYYDPSTGLYYDGNTQYFFNNQINQYMYWDGTTNTYILAPQNKTTEPQPPTPQVEAPKVPEEKKKKDKEDKVKVAKKIAKDMERWARTLNQKKENAKSNVVMEQVLDTSASKGSVDIGFTVLSAGPITHVREISPPPLTEEFLVKKVAETPTFDADDGIIDWSKLTCLLCKRKFPSVEVLNKHKTMSDLHKQNLAEFHKKNDLLPQTNGYRDRAAERRMKFGEDETPIVRKRYEMPEAPVMMPHPPPSVVDTIGGKMLQKMGWSEGRGLGKSEQGRIAPIEAEQRPSLAGLGQKRGIYTPTPGETYRDTVKKLMIARYKEVVGQEDDK